MSSGALMDDDLGLLRRYAAQRDAPAFAELVRRYADFVYATARRVTGSAAAAEDVSQDCFLRLAQRSASISGSVAAWLHRTCTNRSLELLRSDHARRQRETAAVAQRDDRDSAAELISHVDEALTALPDEARIILTEHFLLGRSQAELAAGLKVNQSTVSRRIDSAVAELRERLRAGGIAPAAIITLPMVLEQAKASVAPTTLRPMLSKIGLSGVSASAPAAGRAAWVSAAKLTAASAVVLVGGGFLLHAFSRSSGGQGNLAPAAATATTRASDDQRDRFELDDIGDDDDDEEEADDDD